MTCTNEGCTRIAVVRGLCRNHAYDRPCIACGKRKEYSRRVCQSCFRAARRLIRSHKSTDAKLVKLGLLAPIPRHYFKPGEFHDLLQQRLKP